MVGVGLEAVYRSLDPLCSSTRLIHGQRPYQGFHCLLCEGHWGPYLVPGEDHSPGRTNLTQGREEDRALELGKAFQKRAFGLTPNEQFSRQRRGGAWHSKQCGSIYAKAWICVGPDCLGQQEQFQEGGVSGLGHMAWRGRQPGTYCKGPCGRPGHLEMLPDEINLQVHLKKYSVLGDLNYRSMEMC